MLLVLLLCLGVCLAMAGHYRSKIDALERNPVTRMRIVPRTMYDEMMGVDWVSEST